MFEQKEEFWYETEKVVNRTCCTGLGFSSMWKWRFETTSNEASTQKINVASGGELSTLDSAHYTDVYSSDMIGQVVEGLYRQDKTEILS